MNSAQKIESSSYPPLRRRSDRSRAINLVIEQVGREYANRMRRMTIILSVAAALLVINGLLIATLD